MNDRNKTQLTQNLTRVAALWLDGKGFKPVETEVGVAAGWVADVAGVCTPTQTEILDMKLIGRQPRSNRRENEDVAAYEAAWRQWRAAFDAIPRLLTATIEVKASVSDYRRDRKWTAEAWPTNLCYVAMPEGMIPEPKWPEGWGVILLSRDGCSIRKVHPSSIRPVSLEQQMSTILSLAVARDHVTRHARIREFHRKVLIDDGERRTVSRVVDAISLVLDVTKGRPVLDAIRRRGIRAKLPSHTLKDLAKLHGVLLSPDEASAHQLAV